MSQQAFYRFETGMIKRSEGRRATRAVAYITGTLVRDEQLNQDWDFRRKRGILHSEIMAPDNTPEWMLDRVQLWNAVERVEKRRDAQLARTFLISLSDLLTDEQNLELLRTFITDEFVEHGMIADFSMHAAHRNGDDRNKHAHLALTTRHLTGEGFGLKNRAWNDKFDYENEYGHRFTLEGWRERWADAVNRAFAKNGIDAHVDHRSYADRGIDREPEPKLGPLATQMEREGRKSKAGDDVRAVQARNAEREALKQEILALKREEEEVRDRLQKEAAERAEQARKDEQRRQDETERERLRKEEDTRAEQVRKDEEKRQETVRAEQVRKDDERRRETLREQMERTRSFQAMVEEQVARQTAIWEEKRRAQEFEDVRKYLGEQERVAKEEEERRLRHAVHAREGDITNSHHRYAQAVRNYDIRDPYGSLARVAVAEGAMLAREQQDLARMIGSETDPSKKSELELRKQIEGYDYLAITSERLARMNRTITGRQDSELAKRDEDWAKDFRKKAQALREERVRLIEARELQQSQQEAPQRPGQSEDAPKQQENDLAAAKGEITDEKDARIAANEERARKFKERQEAKAHDRSRHRGGRSPR